MENWGRSARPPILKSSYLGDIMHCPGKHGVDVCNVIEKQVARVGMNCFGVLVGTGYGGGEKEGHQGVHAHFENISPGSVRRRCIPHSSWRTCGLAIRVSGWDYKALLLNKCIALGIMAAAKCLPHVGMDLQVSLQPFSSR